MVTLGSGVLVKLVEEMGSSGKASNDRKPVLLQIRSIIPVLAEDDLWPNQGFYLKVSDSSHAMFVSLLQEQDDMVLCNQLQLGQLIFVEKLEAAHPVPVLKGIRPLPGRFPCVGNPADLFAIDKLVNSKGASDLVMEKDRGVEKKPRGRYRSLSASKSCPSEKKRASRPGNCDVGEREMRVVTRGFRKISSSFVEKYSDSDSTLSSSSSVLTVKRKSWNGAEQVADSLVVKHGMKPTGRRSCSAHASPVRSAKCHSSDDKSSPKTRRISDDIAKKSVKNSNSRISVSAKNCEQSLDPPLMFNPANDKKWSESKIVWNSLPPTLVKLGKEVRRHRDVAVLAAVEALQEASAAESLLKCLSTYSEVQSAKREEQQPSVNKFFDLQDDLARTRLIVQSLTNISPLKANEKNPSSSASIGEALVLALDRKKNATSWIKTALAADLITPPSGPGSVSMEVKHKSHKSSKTHGDGKPKGTCIVKIKHKSDAHFGLAIEKENSQDWVKGSALSAAADLENRLHDECRKWFLAALESYLDEVKSKTVSMESDNHVAEMMCQIKKVGDWLDVIVNKDDSELEACVRIKNKIYGVLLKHVERTAMVLEHMNAMIEDQQQ
ncbi:unnamed protein product [Prunus armeniaca]|uniref:Uncharacterized protein n=1 Tax=Prunus armeniaca TaxID=36596 RepID=A0A6J5VXV4_PRUAR|nr:unnamed protein product [Prunus armeniaca]